MDGPTRLLRLPFTSGLGAELRFSGMRQIRLGCAFGFGRIPEPRQGNLWQREERRRQRQLQKSQLKLVLEFGESRSVDVRSGIIPSVPEQQKKQSLKSIYE